MTFSRTVRRAASGDLVVLVTLVQTPDCRSLSSARPSHRVGEYLSSLDSLPVDRVVTAMSS